ncbi:hypothetical protein CYG33_08950, partial [Campylobacter coli]|nr:hypothetical protein [Campylobacter coli]
GIHFLVGLGVNVGLGWIDYDCLFLLARMNVILEINFYQGVGGKIKCRKRKIKCRIFATNYLSFNLKLKL